MSEELNPITREEMFLAKAAGQNAPELTPITRVERFLQNLIDHIKSIGSGGGGTGGGGATPDWNAAEGQPGHILNRPFYSEYQQSTLYSGTDLVPDAEMGMIIVNEVLPVVAGQKYAVNWNGVDYVCTCMQTDVATFSMGNMVIDGGEDTGEPFCIVVFGDQGWSLFAPLDGSEAVSATVTGNTETVHELDEKYISDSLKRVIDEANLHADSHVFYGLSDVPINLGSTVADIGIDQAQKVKNNAKNVLWSLNVMGEAIEVNCPMNNNGTSRWFASVLLSMMNNVNYHLPTYHLRITVNTDDGNVYFWLEEIPSDKTEMVNAVLAALPTWNGGSY